tara:strand:+ start:224 stop:775 length:552 start_codon:yes stop_codon:yes gene_type:complete
MPETDDNKDNQNQAEGDEVNSNQKDVKLEDTSKPDIEDFEKKYKETYDLLLREKAEMENLKKRTEKEVENAYKYSVESLLSEIIPIYDSLLLSSKIERDKVKIDQFVKGNELLLSMFKQIFEKNNILEINPLDEKFNPDFHQAVSTIEDTSKENDIVSEVVQQGYSLNGRVIKPALVIVIKNQ